MTPTKSRGRQDAARWGPQIGLVARAALSVACCFALTGLPGSAQAGILNDLVHPEGAPDLWDNFNVSGYINGHYMNHDGVPRLRTNKAKLDNLDGGFAQLRELSLFLDLSVIDTGTLSAEIEFADDFGNVDANYLYADIAVGELLPFWDEDEYGQLIFRGGKFLVPFLAYNENKPNFKQYLMSQPFTAWNIVPVIGTPIRPKSFGWSDIGFMVNWSGPVGGMGLLDFKISMITGIEGGTDVLDGNSVVINHCVMNCGTTPVYPTVRPRDGLIQNEGGSWSGTHNDKFATAGKLSFRSMRWPIDVGFSFYYGKWDQNGKQDLGMWGFHANWISRNWTVRGEFVQAHVEQTAGVNIIMVPGPGMINTSTGNYRMRSWFVEGSVIPYRFGAKKDRFVRLILRYDDVDTNDKALFTPFRRSRITAGSELEFFTNARVRFEYQRHKIHNFGRAPGPYKLAGGLHEIEMLMGSLIYSF